jgi:flagellar biosynthesis protein FlhF
VGTDRLLITKLDETSRLGAACSLCASTDLPLSYTTDGRDVPGDLHPADPAGICRELFSRGRHATD